MAADGYEEVTRSEARQLPYPVVYVNADGTYRECTDSERKYLEKKFHPNDGARPYIKAGYSERAGDGGMQGFLWRSQLPKRLLRSR